MGRRFKSAVLIASALVLMLGVLPAPGANALPVCSGPSVAVMASDSESVVADVVAKLQGTCRFSSVASPVSDAFLDIASTTPTPAALEAYDAVFVYTNTVPNDATTLGNNLADYADAGHRVVVAIYGFEHGGFDAGLYGRLDSDGYLPFTTTSTSTSGGPLGLVSDVAASPLLGGVATFSGGSSSRRMEVTVAPGATQVAHWSDAPSTPLVAAKGNVVGLNIYPPSSDVSLGYWDATTDGATLMANALLTSAYKTNLSVKAPRSVVAGSRATVSGKLKSAGATCPKAKSLNVLAGSKKKMVKTSSTGAYSFKLRIVKRTKIRISYAGDAVCAASSKKKVIRAT